MSDRNQAMLTVITSGRMSDFVADFAGSVARKLRNGWSLTEKQQALLERLYAEATGTAEDKPAAPQLAGAGIDGIRDLFATAMRNGAKRPGIKVQIEALSIHLTRAADDSSNPGCIYVKTGGEYAGKIMPTGTFRPLRSAPAALVPALEAFAADPAGVGAASGHATGACCFCNRTLDDARSVTVGYGPTCAARYELPWGDTDAPAAPRRSTRRRAAAQAVAA